MEDALMSWDPFTLAPFSKGPNFEGIKIATYLVPREDMEEALMSWEPCTSLSSISPSPAPELPLEHTDGSLTLIRIRIRIRMIYWDI